MTLDDRGHSVWSTEVDGSPRTWTHDPETSWGRRLMNDVLSWLPLESQL